MSKKIIKLTESDLERIVKRVINETYGGVGFGAEPNGLKIQKTETTGIPNSDLKHLKWSKLTTLFFLVEMEGIEPSSRLPQPIDTTRLGQCLLTLRNSQFPYFIVVRFTEN